MHSIEQIKDTLVQAPTEGFTMKESVALLNALAEIAQNAGDPSLGAWLTDIAGQFAYAALSSNAQAYFARWTPALRKLAYTLNGVPQEAAQCAACVLFPWAGYR